LVAAGILLAAGPAQASTTVGSSLRQRANLYVRCASTCTELQTARPGDTALRVPADGVITRWRLRAATLGAVRLRVLRPAGNGTYATAGLGELQRLAQPHRPGQDVLYTFTARVPVLEGDQIALDHDRAAGGVFHSYGQLTSYAAATFNPAPAADAAAAPTSTAIGRELLLNADIERDADGDGFGDETQDNCPKMANDQSDNPCPPGTAPTTQPGEGPGAQPLPTGGPTGTGGDGPDVEGERAPQRSLRGHGEGSSRRRAPVAGRSGPSSHGNRAGARPAPARRRGSDNAGHRRKAGARPTPQRTHKEADAHRGRRSRPAPQRTPKQTTDAHGRRPARPAPARERRSPSSGHRQRPRPRPTPPRVKSPGFQGH
jgi:hypothetical protein